MDPMTHTARVSIVIALLFSAGLSLKAQVVENDPTLANKVDDYLKSELASKRIPGMSVCVVRDGKVIFTKGYGVANIIEAIGSLIVGSSYVSGGAVWCNLPRMNAGHELACNWPPKHNWQRFGRKVQLID